MEGNPCRRCPLHVLGVGVRISKTICLPEPLRQEPSGLGHRGLFRHHCLLLRRQLHHGPAFRGQVQPLRTLEGSLFCGHPCERAAPVQQPWVHDRADIRLGVDSLAAQIGKPVPGTLYLRDRGHVYPAEQASCRLLGRFDLVGLLILQ